MEQFRKVKVTIFIRKEAWISIVDLIIPAGISPTGVAFVPFFFFRLPLLHEKDTYQLYQMLSKFSK